VVVLPIPKVDDGEGSLFAVVTARQQAAAAVVIAIPFIYIYSNVFIVYIIFLIDLHIDRTPSLLYLLRTHLVAK